MKSRIPSNIGGTAALIFMTVFFANAQNSQFLFDANGNLLVQTGEISAPPQILGQPQNQIVEPGEFATFSVVAANTRSLAYQWRFNGTNIGGTLGDALLLQNVSAANQGEYRVVLANPSGSVTSAPAFLILDSDADGMGDSWETTHFGNLDQYAAGDADGDGASNLQEFQDGSDPANSNSVYFRLLVIRDGGTVIKALDQVTYTNGESVTLTGVGTPGEEPFHAWMGDILTRSNPVTLTMTSNMTVVARFTPIVFTCTNLLDGDWEVAGNWTPNLMPGSNDIVIIPNTTVTLNTPANCADVTLNAGTLTGNGTLTVWGHFAWNSGAMSGSGRTLLETNATLEINTAFASLNSRTLENAGTVRLRGVGSLNVTGGATVTNRPGALFDVQNTATIGSFLANGRLDNAGTFRKSGSTGTATFGSGMSFNNSATVEIQTGTLNLAGGGTNSGTFTTTAPALVDWTGGTYTLNPGAQLSGNGLYRINLGTFTANTNLTVENLDLINGTLDGAGAVTINSLMNWSGGGMIGGGRTIIPVGATLNVVPPGAATLSTRTLENGGTVLWTGAGGIGLNFGAVITNRAGALFHVQSTATLSAGAGANRFDNAGTFRKSTSAGTTTLNSIFNNSGTVDIQTGTLQFSGSFTNNGVVQLSGDTTNRLAGGGSTTGTFATPTTALVEWTGGTFTLDPGAQLNGAGLYRINGISATVVGNGDVTVQSLDLVNASSTLSGTGILTIANAMNWTDGTMSGGGRTIIPVGATLQISNPSGIGLQRTLDNGGSVLWTGAGGIILLNGVVTNRAGGLFNAQNASQFHFAGGGCRFDNAGTFRKSVSTGTMTVPSGVSFNNSGTVDIRSGILAANGGYVSSSNAMLNCAIGGTTAGTNYGQLQVAGTATLNGALSVNLINGFVPALNDAFTVVTAGTRNGTFNDFLYPSNAVTMLMSNTANAVIVNVSEVLLVQQPLLLAPELIGTDIRLTWTANSNTVYRLEYNPGLNPSNWTALPGDVTGISNTASKLDVLTSSNRFYRVRVVP